MFFSNSKKNCVLKRIQEFVEKIAIILNVPNIPSIPENFRLKKYDDRISGDSVSRLTYFFNDEDKQNVYFKALKKMCGPNPEVNTPEEEYALEAEHEDYVDKFEKDRRERRESVITGGRRSRYRHRPTKKYFKSRRHSSHKKKRHHRTKRHTKRHRKTKRHIKRY